MDLITNYKLTDFGPLYAADATIVATIEFSCDISTMQGLKVTVERKEWCSEESESKIVYPQVTQRNDSIMKGLKVFILWD